MRRTLLVAVFLLASHAALAAGTQTVTIRSTTFTDLGSAPVAVQTLGQSVAIVVADSLPSVGTSGTNLFPGPPVTFNPADPGSHVYAAMLGSTTTIAYAPVYSTGGSGGAGSVTQGTVPWVTTATSSGAITNPTSTLTSGTATSLVAGDLIASSATAGSIVVPSFAIANAAGAAIIPKLLLGTSATSGWTGLSVQTDLWSAAPTFTNGDGGVYAVATGSAGYLGSFTCTFGGAVGSANLGQAGDGAYGECTPNAGNADIPKLASGTAIYWSLVSLSTATKASGQTFTLRAEALN